MFGKRIVTTMLVATASISMAADTTQPDSWGILRQAIDAGGPGRATALRMLGVIGSAESRSVLEATLKGGHVTEVGLVAAGLTSGQCALYLPDLVMAAQDPRENPARFLILNAIARAGNGDAAKALVEIAGNMGPPTAGIAFGSLSKMGAVAEPLLAKTVTAGRSALSRETAITTLVLMNARGSAAAFRAALQDPDERVRTAGAVALARWGDFAGRPVLEAAAHNAASVYQTEALVMLAKSGQFEALEDLEKLVSSADGEARSRAVWAIARSQSVTLKQLAYRLQLDREPVFRGMLAEKLLDPGDPRDMAVLQAMIAGGDDLDKLIAAGRLLETRSAGLAEQAVARGIGSDSGAARALALEIVASVVSHK